MILCRQLYNSAGVVNRLFDKIVWYEEYPTTPGLFVLNGFIYSLIGLYDLYETAQLAHVPTNATMLFTQVRNANERVQIRILCLF